MKYRKGFSLIEMLVVVLIFSILGIILTQSLANSLRGSQKSETIGVIKENLEYTTSTMERLLRNAKSVQPCSANPNQIIYTDEYGFTGSFTCIDTDGYVASGSASLRLTSPRVRVLCNPSGGYSPFRCNISTDPKIPSSIDIELRGEDAIFGSGVEGATVTVKTKLLLRNYILE